MATTPPIDLLFDLSALLASQTREWQEFTQIGTGYLPRPVWEEMQFLCDRASEPEQEQTAREFSRFYPNSGWQLTDAYASHPNLKPAAANALSKKARLGLAVAQCAYGLAQSHPKGLVVLVANDQPLLQNLATVGATNLSGVTLPAFLQWIRAQQQPPAITQQLRTMRTATAPGITATQSPATTPKSITGPASAVVASSRSPQPSLWSQLISGVIVLSGITAVSLLAWRVVQPASFQKFWRQTGLPALPGDPPGQKAKPTKPTKP